MDELIAQRMHPQDIAQRLGMHLNAVRRVLPKGYEPNEPSVIPFGLTDKSVPFRMFLADILITMGEKGLSRQQTASITGLNKHESCRAEKRPFNHDWTLSQIERILRWKELNDNT